MPQTPSERIRTHTPTVGMADPALHPASRATLDHLAGSETDSAASSASSTAGERPSHGSTGLHSAALPPRQPWMDSERAARKAKTGRLVSRKTPVRGSSHTTASPAASHTELQPGKEKDAAGFLPRLSRILEAKESKNSRRRASSIASSTDSHHLARRRRRPVEDGSSAHRPAGPKNSLLQRRTDTLTQLPNSSQASILSGVTQQSNASNGSNSTLTQALYDKSHASKRDSNQDREQIQPETAPVKPRGRAPDPAQSNVFQYLSEVNTNPILGATSNDPPHMKQSSNSPSSSSPSSSSSASSSRSEHDDELSSIVEEPPVDSPMTSPASLRRVEPKVARRREAQPPERSKARNRDTSERAQPQHASGNYAVESDEGDEGDADEESDGEGRERAGMAHGHGAQWGHAHHLTLEKAVPPRIPSTTSSRHSDRHNRHLRAQEQELRDHVLQSPQPHRDFQFYGGASPNANNAAMPLYEPHGHAHSGASPVHAYPTAPQAPAWAPQAPPAPPPAAIGYGSPSHAPPASYSPASENGYAMASHAPMAPSNATGQVPPFQHAHAQPPHPHPHASGLDLTRATVVGYESLADKLSEVSKDGDGSVVALYRKFEQLNHRVLLHLQDEISELEEELRYLDECIARYAPRGEAGEMHPASRRHEARYGNEMHYRRTELLGRIYLKLGQYSKFHLDSMQQHCAKRGSTLARPTREGACGSLHREREQERERES
ncbi:hypothetical protein BS50DRAFT_65956 [Corynespora cassiicola Philippines]|uniref:DUF6594 domain-containing protein n=1 Tax=Corynespora cassiicola Philippines TaxID=1448308 RepID=A0A2T2NFL9_CORCC|nr:hypothetical protein BS50DRAFT_65956 [Corynespora cassiicola Philippines]